ncbi:uncharacterized protein LOC123554229 isoform X2 [Mercenaria mercenaria]|uniref:uncharacterized protein LOC123554229 isoform X2 n=1 Tax=Mercenaria mercenaria TaxID=6596 RepID=UPI00234F2CA3|nr:uncharacterized protein LOC123554229 isoform X2 [Mercenaria mercenaria]
MEVTRYKTDAKCYPRYQSATGRLSDISRRTNSLWISTFGVSFPTQALDEEIEKDTQSYHVDLFLFDRNGERKISYTNGTNMLLHNEGISLQESYKYDNMDTFLNEKQHLLKSTSVLIFRDHRCLRNEIKNVSSKQNVVILSSKQKWCTLEKTHAQHPNLKFSTDDKIAADIGSLLEITAFKPLRHTFDIIKSLIDEIQVFAPPKEKANGSLSDPQTTGHASGLQFTATRTGTKRKYGDLKDNWTGTLTGDKIYSLRDVRGRPLENNVRQTRSKDTLSNAETGILPDGNLGFVSSSIKHITDNGKNKFVENKPKFQRLLGEMIGMYKRSKIPDDLKPPLGDIQKETVLNDLYTISSSIQGYSYRFHTRLQIFVSKDSIDRLKPEIVQTLEKHGIKQGDFDIVPPIDAVSHYNKIHSGARVEGDTICGSLAGFVSMHRKQSEDLCAIASKHVLDGQRSVELTNDELRITADVIPETAPGDQQMVYDIAAAQIRTEDKIDCEGRFRNESGQFMKGKMCSYDDDELSCQNVHIYGASTPLGQGIISMTQYNQRIENEESNPNREREVNEQMNLNTESEDREESNINNGHEDHNKTYIVVEDREGGEPFCAKGDSGAMVCADDEDGNYVQLISTVMGESGERSYTTLRLTKAIAKLEEQTESQIYFLD